MGTVPNKVELHPYRVEDETWIALPSSIDGRAQPVLDPENAPFWNGLREEHVVFQRCTACRRYTHFPVGGCQWCGGPVVAEAVPAEDCVGTINTFTVCYLDFGPGMETPYVAAIVNPRCEPEIQLMTNLVNCRVADLREGLNVRPVFAHGTERALLFYEPC